jgi:hypothetical protein
LSDQGPGHGPGYEGGMMKQRVRRIVGSDRGDVPGWVLVAVMTAGLVTALWLIADDQLSSILARAFESVGG